MTSAVPRSGLDLRRSVDDRRPDRMPVPPRILRPGNLTGAVVIIAVLIAAHVLAWRGTDIAPDTLIRGWSGMVRFIGEAVPPDLSWATVVQPGLQACLVTLWIGLLGTTFSVPFSFVLAILGSRATTSNAVVYQLARGLLSFLRAVPDIVFALIFVTAVGLGPFPGVLALIFHNTGVMGKLWSEAMEAVDQGPAEALRIAGAGRTQIAIHAIFPAVLPQLTGLLLYRFDVNVRSSVVLGLVGAGGIGFLINQAIQLFRFEQLLSYILMVLILVIAVDLLSAAIRRRLS